MLLLRADGTWHCAGCLLHRTKGPCSPSETTRVPHTEDGGLGASAPLVRGPFQQTAAGPFPMSGQNVPWSRGAAHTWPLPLLPGEEE